MKKQQHKKQPAKENFTVIIVAADVLQAQWLPSTRPVYTHVYGTGTWSLRICNKNTSA